MDTRLRIRLLGDFALSVGESPVPANSPRLQSLLAYLLLHHDAAQSRQHIAFLLWPDSSEEQALSNLRNLLFQLRHTLPLAAQYLKVDRTSLRWEDGAGLDLDVLQFERALNEAEQAAREDNTSAQATWLQKAIDLYRGDLLPSSYEDWILAERERLQQCFTGALESLTTLFEREGNVQGVIEVSQRLLRHNPLHEAVYKRLMELYAANDMVPEALRLYHTCATTLERELGVEPSANTREIYERLLNTRRVPGQPAHIRGTKHEGAQQEAHSNPAFVQPALRVASPLTGRSTEWALLQEAWREANQGRAQARAKAVLIRGEAGIGKTRLVEELFNWVARQEMTAVSARCYPIERRLAFGPVADWLRALYIPPVAPVWLSEVARLRPGIVAEFPGTPAPGPLTEAWQHLRFMEAISRVLFANQPLLLTLDDLQWCDLDTLEYLHFLMRYDPEARLLLVMSARIEEMETILDTGRAEALAHLLDALRDTESLLEIELKPLGQEETAELAAALSGGGDLDSLRASELYQETEGNPLFIVEMLRAGWLQQMRNNPELNIPHPLRGYPPLSIQHSEGLPPRIARVLKTRLGQLSPAARDLVDVASVIGRDFTLPLLRSAGNESESTVVPSLDELWRRRIVREQGEDGYDFSHDKLRQAAYSMLTAAKRRMLHRRVAHALEEVYAARLDLVYPQLAMHYEIAGDPLPAARYYRQAAQAALQLYANAEAISLYERAFALVQRAAAEASPGAPDAANEPIFEVGGDLGDLKESIGDHVGARSTYERTLGFCPESRPLLKARLMLAIGDTWRAQRHWGNAIECYDASDRLLGDKPHDSGDLWWNLWIESMIVRLFVGYWQRNPVDMQKIAERMHPALERHGSRLQKMRFYRCMASMHLRLERYNTSDECLRYATAALEETRELDNLTELADSTFLMGFCLLWRGSLTSAVDHLKQALSLAERTGRADYQLLSLAYLSIAYRMQGEVQRTRETVARHIAFMDSVQMPSYGETAEANLAWIAWREGNLELAKRHALGALARFSEGESFMWLATWPLVAVSLAQGNLPEAVRFATAQLAPNAQRAPDGLIAAVRGAVDAWHMQERNQAATHLRHALELAEERGYL